MTAPIKLPIQQVCAPLPFSVIPEYATVGAAGFDLIAALTRTMLLYPGQRTRIPTGIAVEVPIGYELQIRPRSGFAWKNGITIINSPGTIDSDYRGEIAVILLNTDQSHHFDITPGMRIAQAVLAPVARANIVPVAELCATLRGVGGFGSTGV